MRTLHMWTIYCIWMRHWYTQPQLVPSEFCLCLKNLTIQAYPNTWKYPEDWETPDYFQPHFCETASISVPEATNKQVEMNVLGYCNRELSPLPECPWSTKTASTCIHLSWLRRIGILQVCLPTFWTQTHRPLRWRCLVSIWCCGRICHLRRHSRYLFKDVLDLHQVAQSSRRGFWNEVFWNRWWMEKAQDKVGMPLNSDTALRDISRVLSSALRRAEYLNQRG